MSGVSIFLESTSTRTKVSDVLVLVVVFVVDVVAIVVAIVDIIIYSKMRDLCECSFSSRECVFVCVSKRVCVRLFLYFPRDIQT